jgi:hypothetical protein
MNETEMISERKSHSICCVLVELYQNTRYFDVKIPLWCIFILMKKTATLIWRCGVFVQALFRKIAAALPGMETLTSTKQEDMVDVNLKASNATSSSQQQAGGCSCWRDKKKGTFHKYQVFYFLYIQIMLIALR